MIDMFISEAGNFSYVFLPKSEENNVIDLMLQKVGAAVELRVNSKPKQTALAIKNSELPNLVLYPLKY